MWGVKVQPDSESAKKLQAYIFLKCPQLYAQETEDAIQTRGEHTNQKHIPRRFQWVVTDTTATTQDAQWKEEPNKKRQLEYNPGLLKLLGWHKRKSPTGRHHTDTIHVSTNWQAGKWVPKTSAKWITQHGVTIHQRTCNASCRTKQDKCWRKTHGAEYRHEYTDSHQTTVMQTSSTNES